MDISIKLMDSSCMRKLLEFERLNREFFEKTCPKRDDSYYEAKSFEKVLDELIKEQESGLIYMYLIYDKFSEIIGRVNLVDIRRDGTVNKAELGYRIGEVHQGKGYATKAVELILEKALNIHEILKVEAGTSSKNSASQNVLRKNGFEFVKKEEKYIYLNGEWHDNLLFEKEL